jgi:hypothetical protein
MGTNEANALISLLQGNVGLVAGVLLCLFGLYNVLVSGKPLLGWVMIIGGVSIPFLPGFLQDLQNAFCPIIQQLGGTCAWGSTGANGQILVPVQGF